MGLLSVALSPVLKDFFVGRVYGIDTSKCVEPDLSGVDCRLLEDLTELDRTPDRDIRSHARYDAPDARCYAARIEGALAGVCWMVWGETYKVRRNYYPLGTSEAKLVGLKVSPEYRGRGIAQCLIGYSTCRMRDLGMTRVFARIYHSNSQSIRAFEKAGYVWVATEIMVLPRLRKKPLRWHIKRADGFEAMG